MKRKRINGVLHRLPADDREALMAEMDGVAVHVKHKGRMVLLVPDNYRYYGQDTH